MELDLDNLRDTGVVLVRLALTALCVWGFWNWLAWNLLNAPTMNYWVAICAVVAIRWFVNCFKRAE